MRLALLKDSTWLRDFNFSEVDSLQEKEPTKPVLLHANLLQSRCIAVVDLEVSGKLIVVEG